VNSVEDLPHLQELLQTQEGEMPSAEEQPMEQPVMQPETASDQNGWQQNQPYTSGQYYAPQPQMQYYTPTGVEELPKKKKTGLRIFAGVLAGVIVLICGISGGYLAGRSAVEPQGGGNSLSEENPLPEILDDGKKDGSTSDFNITTENKQGEGYSYEEIVAKVSPSIVNITVYSPDGQGGSYASGIIMDAKEGYILTNDHIYSETPKAKFLITLNDGSEFKAEFVSGDSRSDIAILKMENPKNLTAAVFCTEPLAVGENVLAIGQSYGYADTVSEGIVSAAERRVNLSNGSYSEKYIQTTAAINPGNSGGALVNMYGQVVGVTSAKIASEDVEGLGFAIPAKQALSIVENLQKNGKVVGRAKLGITYIEAGTVFAEVNKIPTGLFIQEIAEDSGLYGKGFGQGDVITHVNGKEINISPVMLDVIEEAKAGDTITLKIYKTSAKKTQTVSVKLIEAESTSSYTTKSSQNNAMQEEGNDLPSNPFEFYFGDNFGE
jgi:serine protease Do